jgi:hypothetical protein
VESQYNVERMTLIEGFGKAYWSKGQSKPWVPIDAILSVFDCFGLASPLLIFNSGHSGFALKKMVPVPVTCIIYEL